MKKLKVPATLSLLTAFVLMMTMSSDWPNPAWQAMSMAFWLLLIFWSGASTIIDWGKFHRWPNVLRTLGMSLNATVAMANQGRMPAVSYSGQGRWWQPVTESTRLYPLCDWIFGVMSIGDVILFTAIITFFVLWFREKETVSVETT